MNSLNSSLVGDEAKKIESRAGIGLETRILRVIEDTKVELLDIKKSCR